VVGEDPDDRGGTDRDGTRREVGADRDREQRRERREEDHDPAAQPS
jgi:hypothetical protein